MAKASFMGVYSSRGIPGSVSRGAGTQRKNYWFIWFDSIAKTYLAQELDEKFTPKTVPRLLPPDMFRQLFQPERSITTRPALQPSVSEYSTNPFKSDKAVDTTIVTGKVRNIAIAPRQDKPDEPFVMAAPPQDGAYIIPEELDKALRAEFAMGIMRLRRGSKDSAVAEFRRLSKVTDGIVPAHKHMFTDFGKDLRRCKLFELALLFYTRAMELSPQDSHAYFNIARVYHEMGKYQDACDALRKSIELDPDLKCARKLLEETRVRMESFTSQEFKLP